METIKDYTIYSTGEQTKRALELGAPLEFIPMFRYGDNSLPKFVHKNRWNRDEFCYCPTAEQMLGWLRGEGMKFYFNDITSLWQVAYDNKIIGKGCSENKELAAIDAALEFLTINRK